MPMTTENHVRTPDNLVDLDGLFKSTVKGFEGYGILFKIEEETSRQVSGDASGSLDSRAEVRASSIKLWVKEGVNDPVIELNMNKGTPFKKMTVVRLINANGENQVKATQTYENIMIMKYKPHQEIPYRGSNVDGLTCLELRFSKKTNQVAEFDQKGTKKGQNVSGWDYSQATAV